MRKIRFILAVAVLASPLALWPGVGYAQNVDEEVTEQITRQISDSVSRRIGTSIAEQAAGSIESADLGPNTAWISGTYTYIENDGGPDFEIDIFQGLAGLDRDFGGFVAGLSLGISHADADVAGGDSKSNSYSVTPYVAFQFNDNVFADALLGFIHTDTVNNSIDSNTIFTEVALNGVTVVEQVSLFGKLGHRFSSTDTDQQSDDSTSHTVIVSGEAGYQVSPIVTPFVRMQYEHGFPEDADETDDLFLGLGLNLNLAPNVSATISADAELINDDINQYSGGASINIIF